jgi:hypothetical protein
MNLLRHIHAIKIVNWKRCPQDRNRWRSVVEQAKIHTKLQRLPREMRNILFLLRWTCTSELKSNLGMDCFSVCVYWSFTRGIPSSSIRAYRLVPVTRSRQSVSSAVPTSVLWLSLSLGWVMEPTNQPESKAKQRRDLQQLPTCRARRADGRARSRLLRGCHVDMEPEALCLMSITVACPAFQLGLRTPWPESASELYRPSDRRLSAKLVATLRIEGATWSAAT